MQKNESRVLMGLLLGVLVAPSLSAQAADPSARLREVLPPAVAERVLETIAKARERELPPAAVTALENRALKFASRGVAPEQVERAVREHGLRMQDARQAIETGRGARAAGEEIDAGAEVMRQGVDAAGVSALAKSAPSGRSLAVPLFVVASLMERGLPADQALAQVQDRMRARASDVELERMLRDRDRASNRSTPPGLQPGERPNAPGRPSSAPAPQPRRTPPSAPPAGPGRP